MSLSFSLPSLLGEQAPVARRVAIPTARGVPRTAAASETCARARPRVRPGRGSVPAQGLLNSEGDGGHVREAEVGGRRWRPWRPL
ncbi:hypothetical protein PVAP13_9KG251800 [Panicum virgatum]|uniref:Uncharacterized protein n=1 Tax=Panicum virgatum TaxID=38727 RepID=A0A8T0NHI7_PANVG|nr:hypothetical protein PVAP13_9KG251800 [Panicum virgatum]